MAERVAPRALSMVETAAPRFGSEEVAGGGALSMAETVAPRAFSMAERAAPRNSGGDIRKKRVAAKSRGPVNGAWGGTLEGRPPAKFKERVVGATQGALSATSALGEVPRADGEPKRVASIAAGCSGDGDVSWSVVVLAPSPGVRRRCGREAWGAAGGTVIEKLAVAPARLVALEAGPVAKLRSS